MNRYFNSKSDSIFNAAYNILAEAKKPGTKIWGMYAFNDNTPRLYAIGVFPPNADGGLSEQDYKTLSRQAEKNGARRGNDWNDSPFVQEINLSAVKEEISNYKKEVDEKTKLLKYLQTEISKL